jgi:hypothetical protein
MEEKKIEERNNMKGPKKEGEIEVGQKGTKCWMEAQNKVVTSYVQSVLPLRVFR